MKCRGSTGKDGGFTFATAFTFLVYFHTLLSINFDVSVDRHVYNYSDKYEYMSATIRCNGLRHTVYLWASFGSLGH